MKLKVGHELPEKIGVLPVLGEPHGHLDQLGRTRMFKDIILLLSVLAFAGLVFPSVASAECYDPPAAYVVWQKCEFKRICADPEKEKRVNWCKSNGLDGANLKSASLETIVLHHSSLKGVNLEKANLYEADL